MNTYLIEVKHPSGILKKFKLQAPFKHLAIDNFSKAFPQLEVLSVDVISPSVEPCAKKGISKAKQRSYYKSRLAQIRANLQSMTDAEDDLLTNEEILMLQRIACKVDRVIALFPGRTLELKQRGVL